VTARTLAPTPLEIAVGTVLGEEASEAPLQLDGHGETPRAALERALLPALERPPCAVSFSGGRDSSVLLAVAVALARREGLELPVAVSARFVHAPGTGESEWQELVARHLRLEDWARLEVEDELDLVGPVASRLLRRHGMLHPPHTSLFALLAERVGCRSLVTGFGGDQVFGGWLGIRDSERLPDGAWRTAALAGFAAAPRRLRRRALRRELPVRPWLTEPVRRAFERRWLDAASAEPVTWSGYLRWLARRRTMASVRYSLDLVLGECGVVGAHPLLDRGFLASLARDGGRTGLGRRQALLQLLAGDVLPREILERETKAHFNHAYFRGPSRAFARDWDGTGLDPELVEPEPLREVWLARWPRGSSALALQAAWLSSVEVKLAEPAHGLRQELGAGRTP
jgi:asparagine synthase (glutamine-hydrolysing)